MRCAVFGAFPIASRLTSMTSPRYDCIVIGGGPAGLSASLFLARYRRRVLTLHHNSPRNLYSHGVHGFLGHHGILPKDLLLRGGEEVVAHGGLMIQACVTQAERMNDDLFCVGTGGGPDSGQTFEARRIILATGLRDFTPDCEGFREFYGKTVHHCPDCDGFEHTGKRVAVLGHCSRVVGFALRMLTWTDRITVITNGDPEGLTPEMQAKLDHFAVPVTNRRVARIEGDVAEQRLERVCFDDGSTLECDALFFTLGTEPASDLHDQLGCRLEEKSRLVWVDHCQQTSVPGVYAAGDLTPNSQLAVVAAAEGAMAAIQVHQSLLPPERRL